MYRGPGLHPSYLDMFDPASGAAGSYGQPFYLPLFHKQTVIVLREELEYFAMPPKEMATTAAVPQATPNMPPGASPAFTKWKDDCGTALLHRRQIFSALQRSVHKENNVAEQHLIDMLCMSGFEHEDQWGYRAREPSRCGITSTALVLLKTGVTHAGELPGETIAFPAPVGVHRAHTAPPPPPTSEELGEWMDDGQGGALRVDQAQLSTTQKLLLFWRKPAVRIFLLTAAQVLVGRRRRGRAGPRRCQASRRVHSPARHVFAAGAPVARKGRGPARAGVGAARVDPRGQLGTSAR